MRIGCNNPETNESQVISMDHGRKLDLIRKEDYEMLREYVTLGYGRSG